MGTIEEYLENAKEKHEGVIYYTNDISQQSQNISLFTDEGVEVALFDLVMDSQFLAALEHYREGVKFVRVDAGVTDIIKESFPENESSLPEEMIDLFRKTSGNEKLTVTKEALKNSEIPAILSVSEESRRFEDMMQLYALGGNTAESFPLDYSLTLNSSSPLYSKLSASLESGDEKADIMASYIYKLAKLAYKKPSAEELKSFLADSYKLLNMI